MIPQTARVIERLAEDAKTKPELSTALEHVSLLDLIQIVRGIHYATEAVTTP